DAAADQSHPPDQQGRLIHENRRGVQRRGGTRRWRAPPERPSGDRQDGQRADSPQMTVAPKSTAYKHNASAQHQDDFRHNKRKSLHQSSDDFLAQGLSSGLSFRGGRNRSSISFLFRESGFAGRSRSSRLFGGKERVPGRKSS